MEVQREGVQMEWLETADNFFRGVAAGIEFIGTLIIVFGCTYSSIIFFNGYRNKKSNNYADYRRNLGRAILLGLEFLVAGDIVGTIAITPNYESLGGLAIIVMIRTFLSFTMEVEINGRWPWQRERSAE